jgi:hypothetical protein
MNEMRKGILITSFVVALLNSWHCCANDRLSKLLLRNTIKIEVKLTNGMSSEGTGFFYAFACNSTNSVPAIVTCAHVINGATNGVLIFSSAAGSNRSPGRNEIRIDAFDQNWVKHPEVDLAVMPLAPIINVLGDKGIKLDMVQFYSGNLPSTNELMDASAFTSVRMAGYPLGIWDSVNNLPIIRTGAVASDLSVDYNGKPDFLVDIAVFPGSSGSPLVYMDEGVPSIGVVEFSQSPRMSLLGIAAESITWKTTSKVTIVPIPTAYELEANVPFQINLAVIIKAEKLRYFDDYFSKHH